MTRPKAAQRVAAQNVAASLAALLNPARAEASRKNGAKSKGPKTPEGKARSAQNALKHGLRAEKLVVVGDEDPQEFAAFEAAMLDSLAPDGALQTFFAGRVVRAAWRLERAERIEAELFARQMQGVFGDEDDLGLALIRDGNGARAFDTLLRYRASAQAEVFRTLRTLKALQAEAAQAAMPAGRARAQREADLPDPAADPSPELPKEPKARGSSGESNVHAASAGASPVTDAAASLPASAPARDAAPDGRADAPSRRAPASPETPIEPKGRDNPGRVAPVPAAPERQAPMPCIGAPAVRQAG